MLAIPKTKSATFAEIQQRLDNSPGTNTWAGASVNVSTAMQQATVYTCVRILSETIAALPIKAQTKNKDGRWMDSDHDALGLLAEPNEWQTQHDLISMWVAWSELRGNAFSFKAIGGGKVRYLYPLESTGVDVEQLSDWSLRYSVHGDNGFSGDYGAGEIMHLRNFGTAGYEGVSTIGKLRNDIGLAQRAKEHGARVFTNGASAGRWIKATGVKTAQDALAMQNQYDSKYAGAQNSGKTPVMWGGSELVEIGMNAQDAQLLETLKFQKSELASIFGVPGFLVNDAEKSTTWGTGLETITKTFMRFSLRPRLNRIVSTLGRELLTKQERVGTRFAFETDAFTMGGFKEVMEAGERAIVNGILSPNEVRDIVNRNPREGGEIYRESPNSVPEGAGAEDADETLS